MTTPNTIKVTVYALPEQGFNRAGFAFPGRSEVTVDATPEQLARLEAERMLIVRRVAGAPVAPTEPAPKGDDQVDPNKGGDQAETPAAAPASKAKTKTPTKAEREAAAAAAAAAEKAQAEQQGQGGAGGEGDKPDAEA